MGAPSTISNPMAALQAAADAARTELGRVDTKAAALMGWAGTAFAILAATASIVTLPTAAAAAVLLGATLLAAAVAMLLWVIRPALAAPGKGFGFVAHAGAPDADALITSLTTDPKARLASEVISLSALTRTKYRRLRIAVDLLFGALAVLVVALPLGVLA